MIMASRPGVDEYAATFHSLMSSRATCGTTSRSWRRVTRSDEYSYAI
jgi:hypothetical protein